MFVCTVIAQGVSLPPTVLSFEPGAGQLGPSASVAAAVTVIGSCEGPQKLLVRISSSSAPCSTCSCHMAGAGRCGAAADAGGPAVLQAGVQRCSCSVEYVQIRVLVSSPKVALSKYRCVCVCSTSA